MGLTPSLMWASPQSDTDVGLNRETHPQTNTYIGLDPKLKLMWASPLYWHWFISETDDIVLLLFLIGRPFATFSFFFLEPMNKNKTNIACIWRVFMYAWMCFLFRWVRSSLCSSASFTYNCLWSPPCLLTVSFCQFYSCDCSVSFGSMTQYLVMSLICEVVDWSP